MAWSSGRTLAVAAATADGCVVAWQRSWLQSNRPSTILVQRLGEGLSFSGPPLDLHSLRPAAFAISSPAIAARGHDLLLAWRESSGPGAPDDLLVGRLASAPSGGAPRGWIGEPQRVARSLPRSWPRIWLELAAQDRWALLWRQPPDDAQVPHPWLRRLLVPWQGGVWNTGPRDAVPESADSTPDGGEGP